MKIKKKLISLALLGVTVTAYAIVDDTVGFRIGTGNAVSGGSGAVGSNNDAHSSSMSAGVDNYAYDKSLSVGWGNTTNKPGATALGTLNLAEGYDCLVAGFGNESIYDDGEGQRNVLLGTNNLVSEANDCVLIGHSNIGDGFSWAVGHDLIAEYGSVAVGCYNQTSMSYPEDRIFAVGSGDSNSNRRNSIEVFQDGAAFVNGLETYADDTVVLKAAQGDISMGIFGAP